MSAYEKDLTTQDHLTFYANTFYRKADNTNDTVRKQEYHDIAELYETARTIQILSRILEKHFGEKTCQP